MKLNEINDINDLPPLIAYLDAIGVLEDGDKDHIKKAKAIYRKVYKRLHRRKQRQKKKEVTVALSSQDYEFIQEQARSLTVPVGKVLKVAALAYFRQEYIAPHQDYIEQIELTLAKIFSFVRRGGEGTETLTALEQLEKRLVQHLRKPEALLTRVAAVLQENDDFKRKLKTLIEQLP